MIRSQPGSGLDPTVRVAVTFFSSIVVLTPNGYFWIVPLLHSVSDIWLGSPREWGTWETCG